MIYWKIINFIIIVFIMDFIYYIFFLLVIMKKLLLNVGVYIYGISFYKRLWRFGGLLLD